MKAVIIDDEKHCREVLQVLLHKYCPGVTVLHSYASASDSIKGLETQQHD